MFLDIFRLIVFKFVLKNEKSGIVNFCIRTRKRLDLRLNNLVADQSDLSLVMELLALNPLTILFILNLSWQGSLCAETFL